MEGFSRNMARYHDVLQASQMMYGVLRRQFPQPTGELLLERGAGTQFSEHSERVTMRTWAEATGVPPEVCKRLGRWSPSSDEGYMRAQRTTVLRSTWLIASGRTWEETTSSTRCR